MGAGLAVVQWSVLESAADELFNIWTNRFDLHWAQHAWSKLPKQAAHDDPIAVADSLVTLVSVALISQAFWNVAADEPISDLVFEIDDATRLLSVHPFWIGALWANSGCSVTLNHQDELRLAQVIHDLAVERSRIVIGRLLQPFLMEHEALPFFTSIPVGALDDPVRYEIESDEFGDGSTWEMPVPNMGQALEWFGNRCPLPF